jgi:hypothetical protein
LLPSNTEIDEKHYRPAPAPRQYQETGDISERQFTMKSFITLAALSLIVSEVSAHYIFQQLSIGSTKYPVFKYIRQNSNYNSPVTDLTSNDLRCNVGASGASTDTVAVKAGDQFTFTLDTPVYHQGPISMYV